ncbi:hypothetical protein TrST_g7445 [Triparma strigata]|uniref:Uncharacterized protein n=1 Tax=Triparma strigata TaxID=1606541 RepID=A0A9W7BRS7_9STRA|nr:hypothetical protein TrST_g7445 [Triparma strigata]
MKLLVQFLTIVAALAAEAEVASDGKVELHKPVGEDGEGLYTASTKGCFDVINAATPIVLDSIDKIELPTDRPLVIVDYGTADAGTSLGLMSKITDAARSRNSDLEISLQYEDQKDNEWKSVFNHALGYKTVTDAYGVELSSPYKGGANGVFVSACGVSFHEQAYPTGTVDFGMSFTAMHWLSSAPQGLVGRDELQAANCAASDSNCGSAEREQGASDFNKIITARAKELKKGGRMVIVNFSKSAEGHYLGKTERGVSMWDSFKSAWDRLAAEGMISEAERLAISFPSYYRSMKEVEEGAKTVENIKVVSVEEKVVRCPYNEAWVNGESQKAGRSARQHAEWFVPTTRTWSESTFKNALDDSRDKDAIMKRFWSNYVDIVEADPAVHHMDYVHSYLVLEKE